MRICIVAHNAYRTISNSDTGHIGGVELQTSLMAKRLAKIGHEVSLITWLEGGPESEIFGGVHVIKTCHQDSGMPGIRFFYPRWSSLVKALKTADADVYYQNGAEYVTGQVAIWCKYNRRKFVFSTASDLDCHAELPFLTTVRERILYRYGLKTADRTVVQTEDQKKNLRQNFGVNSTVLPMPCDMTKDSHDGQISFAARTPDVVLIGRISKEKNIESFVSLAKSLPEYSFWLIGPDGSDANYAAQIRRRASDVGNLYVAGPLSRQDIRQVLGSTSLLCCTSHYEGFPNTFLEAWSQGVPVVSTVDPGRILANKEVGVFCESPQDMTRCIAELLASPQQLEVLSKSAEQYYCSTHYISSAIVGFNDLLVDTVQSGH